jgi:hypothetical protein
MSYRDEQDRIFQEMEDRRRLDEAMARDEGRRRDIQQLGLKMEHLLAAWKSLKKLGTISGGGEADAAKFADDVIDAAIASKKAEQA